MLNRKAHDGEKRVINLGLLESVTFNSLPFVRMDGKGREGKGRVGKGREGKGKGCLGE